VLTSLLKQVISQLDVVPSAVEKIYEVSIATNTKPDRSTLLQQLILCAEKFRTVYVLLDALDECEIQQQERILAIIDDLLRQSAFKIMITSRPHLRWFHSLPESSIRLEIDAKDVDRDVHTYLSSRVNRERFLVPTLKSKIVETISQQSEGMYEPPLYLSLMGLRFLLSEFQLRYVLSRKETRKVEAALGSLPRDISGAYQEILERIAREGTDELVFKVLSWIFHAQAPLLMDELREALVVEAGDTQLDARYLDEPAFLLEECKSLITFDEPSGIVRFAHSTVQDFLESQMRLKLLNPVGLAKTLLTYLSFDIFKKPCRNELELKSRIDSHKLCHHAARWWPDYARGPGEHDSELRASIFQLFRCPSHVKSLLQIEAMGVALPVGVTLLHFATFHRLSFICQLLCGINNSDSFSHESSTTLYSARAIEVPKAGANDALISRSDFGTLQSRDGFDETPLHIAARKGYKEIVQLYVFAGSDINAKSGKSADLTPLHLAVIRGHDEVVEALVESNSDLETRGRYWRETPLLLAAFLGRTQAVDILLNAKADVSATIEGVGETTIMWALDSPNAIPIVKSLLKAGADVNVRDAQGRTAIHYALHMPSLKMCKEMLQLLIKADALVNIHSTLTGDTPLHTLSKINLHRRQYELNLREVETRFSQQFVNEVWAHRCAIEITPIPETEDVEGAIDLAEIGELLLRSGADRMAKNSHGETPLQCAIKARNPALTYLLLCAVGGNVEFTMGSFGDQEYLDAIRRNVLKDVVGGRAGSSNM